MTRMIRIRWAVAWMVLIATGFGAEPARAATPLQIQAAIDKAQKFLLDHRSIDGTWEETNQPMIGTEQNNRFLDLRGRQWGGLTGLATYALLASGVDDRSDDLKKPLHFLLNANIQSTYGLGIGSQIAVFIPPKDSREFVKHNVAMILAGMNAPPSGMVHVPAQWPPSAGFYAYWTGFPMGTNQPVASRSLNIRAMGSPQPTDWYDRSNSQYAVLGMWALAEAGGEIPNLYWQVEDAAWKKSQMRDGGWNYNGLDPENATATPSMTAAGIATLFITQDYTLEDNWGACRGGIKNEFIERGLHWMDQHISQALSGDYYTMYGIERIGAASGRKYFGDKDWFQIGADYIVKHQNPDGSWNGSHGALPDTSFGLVFLSRGRAPVLMNKLEYQTDKAAKNVTDPWDERPRDLANLAKWVGREEESYFNWQVVNLQVPPEEWHDAPILYLSGSQPLDFTAEQLDKLRTYVEEGGLILGNADCGKEIFAKSFLELGRKLFPAYGFTQTPPNDFIFTEQFKDLRLKPKIMELSNHVRKLMILIPQADLSRAWQTQSTQNRGYFGLGANIFLYAVDQKNLTTKGQTYIVTPDPAVHAVQTMKVARLNIGTNPNPEPAGWTRMAAILHNRYRIDLQLSFVAPDATAGCKVADLTGTGRFSFTPAQRASLRQFVEAGGTLIVDAAGGDVVFADSAESELDQIFGVKVGLLPDNSPIYSMPDNKINSIGWRSFAADKVGDRHHPKVRGLMLGQRIGVFFSREDISAGIVGESVDGIYGYDPETATRLMTGMLVYAQCGGNPALLPKPPSTQPAAPQTKPAG